MRNKLCVDLIGPYKIYRKRKEHLILKSITIIDPVNGWFEVTQYRNKIAMTITNFLETMRMIRYTWSVDITHDRGE